MALLSFKNKERNCPEVNTKHKKQKRKESRHF